MTRCDGAAATIFVYVCVSVCTLARARAGVQPNTQLEEKTSCLLEKSTKSNPIFIFTTRCENIYKLYAMFPIVVVVVGTVKIIKIKLC